MTKQLAGRLISDDLIHIWIENEAIRYYIYLMLKHTLGQHQLLRNEYGSVQTHLEPSHVRDVIIPIPEDPLRLQELANSLHRSIKAKERSWELEDQAQYIFDQLVSASDESENGGSDLTKETFEQLLTRAAQPIQKQPDPKAAETSAPGHADD